MGAYEQFNFKSLDDLNNKTKELGYDMVLDNDVSILKETVNIGSKVAPNKLAILPMEGCDSNPDGSPSELVIRRYHRFASSGAGLLWWEACAVIEEGRANPLQMMITKENVGQFKKLLEEVNEISMRENGIKPINILQLTHSGRYSRPYTHAPDALIPQRDALLDGRTGIVDDSRIITDEYLDNLKQYYVNSAKLAMEAGFDGVDMKSCHRYLLSELLAGFNRPGKYGGSFENRSRFARETMTLLRSEMPKDFILASRVSMFDAHPYPYGFGCDKEDMWKLDLSEPKKLVKMLCDAGVDLLCASAGNPYYIYPQVNRPFDTPSEGIPTPTEHPIDSAMRLFSLTRAAQEVAGDIPVIGCAYSWFREYLGNVGAHSIAKGDCQMVGLGRMAFAYPTMPRCILNDNQVDSKKVCVTCSRCTVIMRNHGRTGCVIRDGATYAPLYEEAAADAKARSKQ
ncbi:NADH:flavin oxidoreductase [Bengtsoniella intestinalis]|uniref:oxidoreductase n=1 Tax=Bengtsoniella intestinalis TaxID=3073143 RepID=UPI00391FC933